MAPALESLGPHRVRAADWSGERVSLDEVLQQLNRLRQGLAHHGAGDYEHPHPRNSVMNLAAFAAGEEDVERAAATGEELGVKHPSRTIIIRPMGGDEKRVDAAVRSHAHELVAGAPVQYEEVRLYVYGPPALHLRSLLEPLLEPDVRTHLWWLGTPPWESATFREVLPGIDTLVVDTAGFDRPYESFLALAAVAARLRPDQGVADFEWVRLHAWREALAQAFAPAARRHFLEGITAVAVEHAGEGRANRGSSGLLAGWLIEALGWKPRQEPRGSSGASGTVYRSRAGRPVEIEARPVAGGGAAPEGAVMAIRVEAAAHGSTCRAELVRDREQAERAVLTLRVDSDEALVHDVRLPSPRDAALLSELLMTGRRDPVYLRSLRGAAELLQAVA